MVIVAGDKSRYFLYAGLLWANPALITVYTLYVTVEFSKLAR